MISALLQRYHRHVHLATRFGLVGVANTGVDFVVFTAALWWLGLPLLVANTSGYLAGVLNSFFFNRAWTFAATRTELPFGRSFAFFFLINLIGLGLSNGTMWLLAPFGSALGAKLVATGVTFGWNFWGSQKFAFAARPM